jgi:hypothetical protein
VADAGNERRSFRLDAYTIIIIALIPSFMLIAAGATWFYDRAEAKRACSDSATYLADATDLVGSFQNAGTLGNAGPWLTSMESLTPPSVASDLHEAAMSTVQYGISTQPNTDTTSPGAVYDAVIPFQDSLDSARAALVQKCPETAPQIPQAFPMFFREDSQQP